MKRTPAGFLRILGAYELHRHAPGAIEQLSKKSDLCTSFKSGSLIVDLCSVPPIIEARTAERLANSPRKLMIDVAVGRLLDVVRQADGTVLPIIACGFGGDRSQICTPFILPRSAIKDVEDAICDPSNSTKPPYLTRFPATDTKGQPLAFILDEIDTIVMEARKTFHPPSQNDEFSSKSPKTIYDYVEQKVASRRPEPWTKCLHALEYTQELEKVRKSDA